MFLRKLTVIVLPLALCLIACLLLPLTESLGFFSRVLTGLGVGCLLSLLLPLSGAVRRREPFGGLLAVPSGILALLVLAQYLRLSGAAELAWLSVLADVQPNTVLVECAFIGFMLTTCLRTKV